MVSHHDVRLERLASGHAAEVASWCTSRREAELWCSYPHHPVPAEVVASWAAADGCEVYGLVDGERLIGYGELWVDDEPAEVELAHLIVAPDRRGRGVGCALAALLLDRARVHHPDVFLRVRPDNAVAIRSYERAGFERVGPTLEAEWNAGQPHPYVWMTAPPPTVDG